MRFFAEEKKSGTLVLLMTKPLTDLQVILSKYFAGITGWWYLLSQPWYTTFQFTSWHSRRHIYSGGILGFLHRIIVFGRIVCFHWWCNLCFSSDRQPDDFLYSRAVLCGFILPLFEFIYNLDLFGKIDLFIRTGHSLSLHHNMSKGVIDTRDVLYFLSLIIILYRQPKYQSKAENDPTFD